MWTNTFIFIVYFFVAVFMPFFEDILCVDEGQMALLCPINSNYKWYELSMGCLALIGFASLTPSLSSKPALALVTPSRLGTHFTSEGTNINYNNRKAVLFLGAICCPLTYWVQIYQLLYINSIACWLQQLLSSLFHLYHYYTPVYTVAENSRDKRRSPYDPVTEVSEDLCRTVSGSTSFQDVVLSESESSDTDIDSIVEEYHDKIKVMSGSDEIKRSPTELTGKTSYCCLAFMCGLSSCTALSIVLQYYILALYTSLGLVCVAGLLLWLPRRNTADFKTTFVLVVNFSLSTIMLIPLLNTCTVVITCLLILTGVGVLSTGYMKKKMKVVKITVKLKHFTNSLYSTKLQRVQNRAPVQT